MIRKIAVFIAMLPLIIILALALYGFFSTIPWYASIGLTIWVIAILIVLATDADPSKPFIRRD